MKGIDVSSWQGDIDWNKVKNAGIQFAMIRLACGTKVDVKAKRNITECIRVGISVGIYIYSYALNLTQAEKEAKNVISALEPYKKYISYPVCIDMEDADGYKTKYGMPSNDTLVDICVTECEMFEKAGYYAMIYASKSWFSTKLNSSKLDRFDKWLAWWYDKAVIDKSKYGIWQYSDAGKVDGIKGSVDMNEAFKKYTKGAVNVIEEKLIKEYGATAYENALRKLIESVNDDGEPSDWAEYEFNDAIKNGITDGTRPEMFATRQETAIMCNRAIKLKK